MTADIAVRDNNAVTISDLDPATLESLIVNGDCSKLNPQQRVAYYRARCDAAGLDYRTQPLQFINLQGKLVLYALKGATDQLAANHGIVCEIVSQVTENEVRTVTVRSRTRDGRQTDDAGCVFIGGKKGDDLCNAFLKAITKAKRRAVLSLCGLGMLDESEIETIPASARQPVTAPAPHHALPASNTAKVNALQAQAEAHLNKPAAPPPAAVPAAAFANDAPAVQPPKPGFKVMAGSEGWPVYWVYAIYKPAPGQSKYDIYLADSMKVGGSPKKGVKYSMFVDPSKPEESERIQTIEAAYASNSPLRYSVKTNVKGDKTYHNIVDVSVIPAAALNEMPNEPEAPPPDNEDVPF